MSNSSRYNVISKFRETISTEIYNFKISQDELAQNIIKIDLDVDKFLDLINKTKPPCIFFVSKTLKDFLSERNYQIDYSDFKDGSLHGYIEAFRKEEIKCDQAKKHYYKIFMEADLSLENKERIIQLFLPFNGNYLTIGEIGEEWIENLKVVDFIDEYAEDYNKQKK